MAATTSISRFLLPQNGLIWRNLGAGAGAGRSSSLRVPLRFASSSSSPTPGPDPGLGLKRKPQQQQPQVLAKPERFNPPSHGARLPRSKTGSPASRHYGGDLSKEELVAQLRKEYPGLMAPGGTWAYRIIYSRWIHLTITIV